MATSTGQTGAPAGPGVLRGLAIGLRPKQWVKNVLLLAAPAAADRLLDGEVALRVAVAVVAFAVLSSGTYLLNDAADAEADRLHPTKRLRPVASGAVPVAVARGAGALLVVAGLSLMAVLGTAPLATLVVYLVVTLSYTHGLKHVAVIDLACVASGFVLRAIAGGVAAEVPVSKWFLIVAGSGSMFMVAGKRHAEFVQMGEGRAGTRPSLAGYSVEYLRFVWMLSAAVCVGAYAQWAFEDGALQLSPMWAQLSVVPFVLALLRYALDIDRGDAGAPEDVVIRDRKLQLLGLVWLLTFAVGVRLGG